MSCKGFTCIKPVSKPCSWNEADPLTRCPDHWIFQFSKMPQAEYRQKIRGHTKTGRRRCQFNSCISNNNVIDQTERWHTGCSICQTCQHLWSEIKRVDTMQRGHFGAADNLRADLKEPFCRNSSPSLAPGSQLCAIAVKAVLTE